METEILCTLGPSSMNVRVIKRLEELNASLFRINLSHTAVSDVAEAIHFIQKNSSVPVCLDTEGAQVRTGDSLLAPIMLAEHSFVKVCRDYVIGNTSHFNLYPRNIVDQIEVDDFISIDFNEVLAQVVEKNYEDITLRIINGGKIGQNKAVTIERSISLPPLTEKDTKAISIGRELGIRHFALSFAGLADEVNQLRKLAGDDSFIISKIESRRGLKNIKEIASASDALLIDRGDMSREVPIERIPAIQKQIMEQGKNSEVKVYVATNLLESMITAPSPTRAEVNDIYNTLIDGASGLVLAAETAIGQYPVQCASMVASLIREFSQRESNKGIDIGTLPVQSQLIEPHGGQLIQCEANDDDRVNLVKLKSVTVDQDLLGDCQMIATGVYSPLTGFMNSETLASVLDENKLPEGVVWTMPIIFPVSKKIADTLSVGERVKLVAESGQEHALLDLTEIYRCETESIAKKWFGTTSPNHPGVDRFTKKGEYILAGSIKMISPLLHANSHYDMTPNQCRFVFNRKGWHHVVAFHTRNVAHRAHEHIQLKALKETNADGLFINPVLGGKKYGDFLSVPIMKSYQLLLDSGIYPKGQVVLGSFSTYSRYCGPREAVFTALCRKNMGCNYIIIGRDHTGVGDYYEPEGNQRLFESLGECGIKPVYFDSIGYDQKSQNYISMNSSNQLGSICATSFREAILRKESVPDWFVRKQVQELLFSEISMGRSLFHE
jgi:ATP sulfurylase